MAHMSMNPFRILADVSHTASKCILIWSIHSNKSSEGVSLLTQVMYIFVFVARYLDLFWVSPGRLLWNFVLKIFYITSSVYIIVLMTRVFARTREREKSWKLAGYCNAAALVLTPLVNLIFNTEHRHRLTFVEFSWTFSIILESVCVLPQLLLLRQTAVPTVIDSFYLVTLGSYRAFYLLNWIYRAAAPSQTSPDPVSVIFGIIQTAFYLDFAWVYWTRQRVKLRGGGIVDADDLRKGFLVNRFMPGRNETADDVEAEGTADDQEPVTAAARQKPVNRWGARGVSISADDTLADRDRRRTQAKKSSTSPTLDDHEEEAFLSDADDGDDQHRPLQGVPGPTTGNKVLNSKSEWRK